MKCPVDIYLAGGMKCSWRDTVKRELKDLHNRGLIRWSDPRANNTIDPNEYESLDMIRVRTADVIFGYAEGGDPELFALCVELSVGKENGAITILANEINAAKQPKKAKYFRFVGVVCDFEKEYLNDAIQTLRKVVLALTKSDE